MDLAAATIVAKPYLSFARVLARSFQAVHPDVPFFVLLADEIDSYFDPTTEPTHLLGAGARRVVFFKQESLVLGDHSTFFDLLARHSIVLTPHLIAPLASDDRIARELNILQSGIFNVGLLGVSDTPETRRFLRWWAERVYADCRHSVPEGIHYEQRWLDLVPGFFDGVHLLRDPAYNVGHWNLSERDIHEHDGRVWSGDRRCALFRFSGFSPDSPRVPSRYSRRLTWENIGAAREVFERFRAALEDEGYGETSRWPYAYARFDNGAEIADMIRAIYLQLGDATNDSSGGL